MEYDEVGDVDSVPIRVPANDGDRTRSVCGEDCQPEPTGADGLGIRIAFVCAEHGAHSVVDPFESPR